MSKWFKHYDTSSDEELESSSDSSSNDSSHTSVDSKEGLKKWLKKKASDSDNDSTSRDNTIVSKEEKIKNDIVKVKEFFREDIEEINWKGATTQFKKIVNISINDDVIEIFDSIEKLYISRGDLTKEALYYFNRVYKLYSKLISDNSYTLELYKKRKEKRNINESPEDTLENELNNLLSRNVENIIETADILIKKAKDYPKIRFACLSLKVNESLGERVSLQSFKKNYMYIKELLDAIGETDTLITDSDLRIKKSDNIKLSLIVSIVIQILHSKYINILQNTLPETEKYNDILQMESDMFLIYESVITYYEQIKIVEYKRRKCEVLLCYLSLIYNKSFNSLEEKRLEKNYKYIIRYSDSDIDKSKVTLYYIYSLLANNNIEKGITELINSQHYMEHPNSSYYIINEEIAILYNQVLARLGYVSFINKDIENVFWNLNELCQLENTNMILGQYPLDGKEYLLIPFHQHIDTEVLLELYLISCMLLDSKCEIYNNSPNRKSISKLYAAILYKYKNEPLTGNLETLYEKIYKSSRFLINGDWKECCDIINTLDYFKTLENDIKQYIFNHIKMTALEAYVKHSQEFYKSIYFQDIIDKFSMTYENTTSKISKMITSDKIKAKIDKNEGSLDFSSS